MVKLLVLFFVLYLSEDALSCSVWMKGMIGTVSPSGEIIEPIGATIKIDCLLNESNKNVLPGDSSNLIWKKNADFLPREYIRVIDNYTAQLEISNVTMEDSGMYHCYNNMSNTLKLVCGNDVRIGYPPTKVRDFDCVSPGWKYLICSFTKSNNTITDKYSLSYYTTSAHGLGNCNLTRAGKVFTCNITEDVKPIYRPTFQIYTFKLTATNKLGSNTTIYKIDQHKRVLTSEPKNFKAINNDSTNVRVQWDVPSKNFSLLPGGLKYRLSYRSQWDSAGFWKTVQIFNKTSVALEVVPYTQYNFSVQCMSARADDEKYWGSPAFISHTTISAVPGQPPTLTPGSYEEKRSLNSRKVMIFWQTIPPYERNGPEFTHTAYAVATKSQSLSQNKIMASTVFSNCAAFNNLSLEESYKFEVFSVNSVGMSTSSTSLLIETHDNTLPQPESFTAIYFDHGIYELSWRAPPEAKEIMTYKLFWCSNIKPHPFHCQGNLSWINVDDHVTARNITLQDKEINYQFAIASITENSSSGLVWATCIVPYNGTLNRMKKVSLTTTSKSSLKVSWILDCSERIGIVTGFRIFFCIGSSHNNSAPCVGNVTEEFANGSHIQEFEIKNLKPFTFYKVTVSVVTRAGDGEHSKPMCERTYETTPEIAASDKHVINVTNTSIEFTWKPPIPLPGVIKKYIIYGGEEPITVAASPNQEIFSYTLTDLYGYKNYSIQLSACITGNSCSPKSDPLIVQTDVGVPGIMGRLQITSVNSSYVMLSFEDPSQPNGPINYYNLITTWETEDGINQTMQELNITKETLFATRCTEPDFQTSTLKFSIQAVNIVNDKHLAGPVSEPVPYHCLVEPVVRVIIIAAASTFGVIALLVLFGYGYCRFRSKCREIQNIIISIPKGLEPESLKPSNFHSAQPPNRKKKNAKELLNQFVNSSQENARSRNTSGETRISTSSIDELLQSGDKRTEVNADNASALGSISSTQTTRSNLSSESGNDIDSLPPTTPDMVFLDHPMNTMKTLPEIEGSESGTPVSKSPNLDACMPASYSKFACYLGDNLPGVKDGDCLPTVCPIPTHDDSSYVLPNPAEPAQSMTSPYSQVGLAAEFNYVNHSNILQPDAVPSQPAFTTCSRLDDAAPHVVPVGSQETNPGPSDAGNFGYSAVGLAANDSLLSPDILRSGYVTAALAGEPFAPSWTDNSSNLMTSKAPPSNVDFSNNVYVPRPSEPSPSNVMYSQVCLPNPESNGYVSHSQIEKDAIQNSSKPSAILNASGDEGNASKSFAGKGGQEFKPLISSDSSGLKANKPISPKKNGYVSVDILENGIDSNVPCSATSQDVMKTSQHSDEFDSPGRYSRVVSMTFDEPESTHMPEDKKS